MRENRTYGSEGGEGHTLPDPYLESQAQRVWPWMPAFAGILALQLGGFHVQPTCYN